MIQFSIHKDKITIINTYASYVTTHEYIKQTLTELKAELDSNILEDFNIPLLIMNRIFRQKLNK